MRLLCITAILFQFQALAKSKNPLWQVDFQASSCTRVNYSEKKLRQLLKDDTQFEYVDDPKCGRYLGAVSNADQIVVKGKTVGKMQVFTYSDIQCQCLLTPH